ncbi:MAG: hypothetical protein DRZ79_01050, partial [Candidatus Cloacimonadota bacterium]
MKNIDNSGNLIPFDKRLVKGHFIMILTRKLQLKLRDVKHAVFLNQLNDVVFRAYNEVVNVHYFSELFRKNIILKDEELNYQYDKINDKLEKNKEKIKVTTDATLKDKLFEENKKLFR